MGAAGRCPEARFHQWLVYAMGDVSMLLRCAKCGEKRCSALPPDTAITRPGWRD